MNNKCIKELYVEYGLVDIQSLHPSIKSDIRYATKNNFTGKILYTEDNGLFCIPALAEAIGNAQRELININPTLSLVVFDAARPLSIQRDMFELVKGTDAERYIANPYQRSISYGRGRRLCRRYYLGCPRWRTHRRSDL